MSDPSTVFDMNQCKQGDALISRLGMVLIYVGRSKGGIFPHVVQYPDGAFGTRYDNGRVSMRKPLPTDHDIVGFASKVSP